MQEGVAAPPPAAQPTQNWLLIGGLALTVLLAIIGWWRYFDASGELEAAQAQAAQQQTQAAEREAGLKAQVDQLTGEGNQLKTQLGDVQNQLAELQKVNGEIAAAQQKLQQ